MIREVFFVARSLERSMDDVRIEILEDFSFFFRKDHGIFSNLASDVITNYLFFFGNERD